MLSSVIYHFLNSLQSYTIIWKKTNNLCELHAFYKFAILFVPKYLECYIFASPHLWLFDNLVEIYLYFFRFSGRAQRVLAVAINFGELRANDSELKRFIRFLALCA